MANGLVTKSRRRRRSGGEDHAFCHAEHLTHGNADMCLDGVGARQRKELLERANVVEAQMKQTMGK